MDIVSIRSIPDCKATGCDLVIAYLAGVVSHNVVADTNSGIAVVKVDTAAHDAGSGSEILTFLASLQEGTSSRASLASTLRDLETSNSVLWLRPVIEVTISTQSESNANLEEPLTQGVLVPHFIHHPKPFLTMKLGGTISHIHLCTFEVWENISSRPLWNPPVVVVLSRTTVVKAHI